MSATTMVSETALHSDMRSAQHAYKRDKDSSVKWGNGRRRLSRFSATSEEPVQLPYKMRPKKRDSELPHPVQRYKSSNSSQADLFPANKPNNPVSGRIARRDDAIYDSTCSSELTKSLLEILPTMRMISESKINFVSTSTTEDDEAPEDVLYSFDKTESPHNKLGLEFLVDHAEKQFMTGETERIVREEWETIDEHGQVLEVKNRKQRKSNRSKVEHPTGVVEDDWELLSVAESQQ